MPQRSPAKVAVIINPISGTGGRPELARRRAERAAAIRETRRVDGQVFVTERAGHAKELAYAAVAQGCSTIVAWGGDGTVNEVGSVVAFGDARLAIIPSGSGNGLARDMRIPFDPDHAFHVALEGAARVIDAGELDGHLFFNVAGIGLDARVAHRFAEDALVHRGFKRYVAITLNELFNYEPADHTIVADGESIRVRALLVALANGRQYGNGALIAPFARIDDGRLEVVVVGYRRPWQTLWQMPRLFMGKVARVPGVSSRSAEEIEITSNAPMLYHVDGEPRVGGASLKARVHAGALRVIVPDNPRDRAIIPKPPCLLARSGDWCRPDLPTCEEHDDLVVRRVRDDDWHRVERAKMTFARTAVALKAAGWEEH